MHEFLQEAMKLLQRYKLFVKKKYSKEESQSILCKLELYRSLPRDAAGLYRLVTRVTDYLTVETAEFERVRFSGRLKMLNEMRGLLELYRLENNRLFHAPQLASSALVKAIQLMTVPTAKQTSEVASQLKECALKIVQYGVEEQRESFWNALIKQVEHNETFFFPIMAYYKRCLAKQVSNLKACPRVAAELEI